MNSQAKRGWVRRRHGIVRNIAYAVLYPYAKIKYGISVEKFPNQKGQAYLILLNHQTPFDQFFVGMAFSGPVYYLATEDIFSLGWVSSLIRWLVAPIPIKKQTTDIGAVKTCIRVAREGGTIAIAPEGNRTYSGKTEHMSPTIAGLAKKLNLPIALFRIEGGYGVQPLWSDVVRRGKMRAYVSQVITPEEYASMTNEALFSRIREGLDVNEAAEDGTFLHKNRAEYLERVVYVCPDCGLAQWESHGAVIGCKGCGRQVEYLPTKALRGIDREFPFRFVNDWYEYQQDFVRKLDLTAYTQKPMFTDCAQLSEVILKKRKNVLRKCAGIKLYGDRLEIDGDGPAPLVLAFAEIYSVAVLGRNKLNVYHGETVYQFKGGKRFNALKYVNLIYHYKNVQKGIIDGEFLGL